MQPDSGIKVPLIFSGLPLKGTDNPFLIIVARFNCESQEIPYWWDKFKVLVREATGFSPKPMRVPACMPLSSQYVLGSKLAMDYIAKLVGLSSEEVSQTLEMLDEAMFGVPVLKALRISQDKGKSLLFRDGEDPIYVEFPAVEIKVLAYFPLTEVGSVDSSIIHLAGITPVRVAQNPDSDSVRMENGLWFSLFGLPIPKVDRWKWTWDLEWASLLEYSN
ncbi:hypothetical protein MetMK1DRAFT_00029990 [Metallosphaera yellowstonensis MK1]|uniref:Uncharacterized protein n=1 Tax=Metallosphaera yellowstonensis MK1 TaxID=671065 RepID=H2C8T2_9CREN|nr:hypothetical protein MetMK1DRAFT_00029990 [Metallosphaera yellowstonensis MK1]